MTETDPRKFRESLGLRVLVVGGGLAYIRMLRDAGFLGASSLSEADFVLFTGGEDISPSLYGEEKLPVSYCNPERDSFEQDLFDRAKKAEIPMVGICRGGQLLNALSGGKMWQHVDNHGKSHTVTDLRTGRKILVTSTHHQMMIPGPNAEVIAVASESTLKVSPGGEFRFVYGTSEDFEVLWYSDTLSLCFQPHPEYESTTCRDYFLSLVDEFIVGLF